MEIWDLYDVNRAVIGEHIRGAELSAHGYHQAVHVRIRNSQWKYLMSKRSKSRPTFPLMRECVGGSVLKGESSLQWALRKAQEDVNAVRPKRKAAFFKNQRAVQGYCGRLAF